MLLAAAPRRLSVAAPRALRLRWRAAHGVAGGTGAAALAAARSPAQPKHHNRRSGPSAVAVAAAAAAAQGARSTSGVDPRRLLGFTVLDLTAGMAEVGVVDDVSELLQSGLQSLPATCCCLPRCCPRAATQFTSARLYLPTRCLPRRCYWWRRQARHSRCCTCVRWQRRGRRQRRLGTTSSPSCLRLCPVLTRPQVGCPAVVQNACVM